MIDLTIVSIYFLPRVLVIITICCRKLHAIVIAHPVSSCALVFAQLKPVVVAFIFDVKITKINTKSLLLSSRIKVSQSVCICCAVATIIFTDIPGWLIFST